jgi:hypothetical protein
MKTYCTGCDEDCSHAYGTWMGDPYHFGCIPLRRKRDRRAETGDVPTPPEGSGGLPVPASQDPLKRLY